MLLLNPIINLVLTVISAMAGLIIFTRTDDAYAVPCALPALVFALLFLISLLRPVRVGTERRSAPGPVLGNPSVAASRELAKERGHHASSAPFGSFVKITHKVLHDAH